MAKQSNRELRMLRESVLWHAAAKHGGKLADRDLLAEGASYAVDATLAGTVDGQRVELPLVGQLIVNHDQLKATSTGPKVERILAAALAKLPAKVRTKFVDECSEVHLDSVDPQVEADCRLLMQRLRTTTTQTARGAVRFEPAGPSPEAEAAKAA